MNRWDIINHLIIKNNYKSYLEIGYYKGWSFDNVKCDQKTAVDPNPCKTEVQQMLKEGYYIGEPFGYTEGNADTLYKMTSDKFFQEHASPFRWDIIFIDGLHESTQVSRDINNALKHLSPGGTIVLHDCNPPRYEHTTTGIDGCWTGDAYKAFVKWRMLNPEYESYTVDTDWGCGVITQNTVCLDWIEHSERDTTLQTEWSFFNENRKELLNLISIDEFLKRNSINETIIP